MGARINIYQMLPTGGILRETVIYRTYISSEAVHEEEMSVSNFIRLTFAGERNITLPAGAYIKYGGVKYRLLEKYVPKADNNRSYKYAPEFHHPIMLLSRTPYFHLDGNTSGSDFSQIWANATKETEWSFYGYAETLVNDVITYINSYLQFQDGALATEIGAGSWNYVSDDFGRKVVEVNVSAADIMSVISQAADQCGCEFHFDISQKKLYFGDVANMLTNEPFVFKSGFNVTHATVTSNNEEYYNRYIVRGGTTNLSQPSFLGGNVKVTKRLTLPDSYTDSILDLRGNANVPSDIRSDANEPALTGQITLDDVYPHLKVYIYNPRERQCYKLDEEGNELTDQIYSKWYIRLAYHDNKPSNCILDSNDNPITFQKDGVTHFWHPYIITDEMRIQDTDLQISFLPNYDTENYSSPLVGRTFVIVPFYEDTQENEHNVNEVPFDVSAGEYRIDFEEDDGLVIPTGTAQGLYPQGAATPSIENNIVSVIGVVVTEELKDEARAELLAEAISYIQYQRKNRKTYTFDTYVRHFNRYRQNPNFRLYVGQKVIYDDGGDLIGGTSMQLETKIRKLVTHLTDPNNIKIDVGNERIVGRRESYEKKVDTLITYVGSAGGGTISDSTFLKMLMTYGRRLFLSKSSDDTAAGSITFLKESFHNLGATFGPSIDVWGYIKEIGGKAVAWFKNLQANVLKVLDHVEAPVKIERPVALSSSTPSLDVDGLTVLATLLAEQITSENLTNTDTIKTKNLVVTGLAHFFELVIDKIRATAGAEIKSAAEGFVVEDVLVVGGPDPNEQGGDIEGRRLYFLAKDNNGKQRVNTWKPLDQAICMTFNAATGTSYNVSNKYFWALVYNVSEQPSTIIVNGEERECHYIDIYTGDGSETPQGIPTDENGIKLWDGLPSDVEAGDEIAMLGYRGTDDDERQSAIYESAYGGIDTGLVAPFRAHYQGINDFDLASHRKTYSDARGSRFIGKFYATGDGNAEPKNIEDLLTGTEFDIIYGQGSPSVTQPESSWDSSEYDKHSKTLYFDTSIEPASTGGRMWKWTHANGLWQWVMIRDVDTVTALEMINNVASDNIITGGAEKHRLRQQWLTIITKHDSLDSQARQYGLDTDDTIYRREGNKTYRYEEIYNNFDNALYFFNQLINGCATYSRQFSPYPLWINDDNLSVSVNLSNPSLISAWNTFAEDEDSPTECPTASSTLVTVFDFLLKRISETEEELQRAIDTYLANIVQEAGVDGVLSPKEKALLRTVFAGEVSRYFQLKEELDSLGTITKWEASGSGDNGRWVTVTLFNVRTKLGNLGTYLNGGEEWAVEESENDGEDCVYWPTYPSWIANLDLAVGSTSVTAAQYSAYWQAWFDARDELILDMAKARQRKIEDLSAEIEQPHTFTTETDPMLDEENAVKEGDHWYKPVTLVDPVSGETSSEDTNGNKYYDHYVCKRVEGTLSWVPLSAAQKAVLALTDYIYTAVFGSGGSSSIVQQLGSISQKVNGMSVGLMNLILNSDFASGTDKFAVTSSVVQMAVITEDFPTGFDRSLSVNISQIPAPNYGDGIVIKLPEQPNITLEQDTFYTLSFYFKFEEWYNCTYPQLMVRRGDVSTVLTDYTGWNRVSVRLTGDGASQSIYITMLNQGTFLITGLQLERGGTLSTWRKAEEDWQGSINLLKDQIELSVTKNGLLRAGIGINGNDESVTLFGKKVNVDGDLDIQGLTTENVTIVDWNTRYPVIVNMGNVRDEADTDNVIIKSVQIKARNVSLNDGFAAVPPIVALPFYDSALFGNGLNNWAANTNITFDETTKTFLLFNDNSVHDSLKRIMTYTRNGTRLTIVNEADPFVINWQGFTAYEPSDTLDGYLRSILGNAVIVCADPRIICYENAAANSNQLSPINTTDDDSKWNAGLFSCGGYLARFIAVLPGQSLQLRSQIVTIDKDNNSQNVLMWIVENPTEFEPMKIGLELDSGNGVEIYQYGTIPTPDLSKTNRGIRDCWMGSPVLNRIQSKSNGVEPLMIAIERYGEE